MMNRHLLLLPVVLAASACANPGSGTPGTRPLELDIVNNMDDGPVGLIHCRFEGSGGCSVLEALDVDESATVYVESSHWIEATAPINGTTFCAVELMERYVNTQSTVFELLYASWDDCPAR